MNRIISAWLKGVRDILSRLLGFSVTKSSTIHSLVNSSKHYDQLSANINFLKYLNENKLRKALDVIETNKSQIQQDLFVLLALDFKKDGYFVEFGATNGVYMSNSWVFEKRFGWKGIVAEPGTHWHLDLLNNRQCQISTQCVWTESGKKILFNEAVDAGFSTINEFTSRDHHSGLRTNGKQYYVETITLNDLLDSNNAPTEIDYLSIDTEGSEYDILDSFDFNKWKVSIITVEHNYTENREKIQALLESKGYIRVLTSISQFDDWYVKPKLMRNLEDAFLTKLKEGGEG